MKQLTNGIIDTKINSINDTILHMRYNMESSKDQKLLQGDEILEIVSKYKASQKFISRMLGWGEITLTRYINNNYAPNQANSAKIRSIENPYVFKKLLETRVDETDGEILKDAAFIKLLNSVNNHIKKVGNSKGKIFRIANWFLSQADDENRITLLALQQLLYFSQAWSLAINDKSLFEEECKLMKLGPKYRVLHGEFQEFGYGCLPRVEKPDALPDDEEMILECVKKYYYDVYTAKTIGRLYCAELNIKKDSMEEYYKKMAQEYNITRDTLDNVKKYLADLYLVVEMPIY